MGADQDQAHPINDTGGVPNTSRPAIFDLTKENMLTVNFSGCSNVSVIYFN